ncbi:mechanosensitive ion channel family protein [Candidatus Microgenomates bacterium]|nr:MAG: mechanosensitive ion channel family protein [Candidatus Microgenomates bacterium]
MVLDWVRTFLEIERFPFLMSSVFGNLISEWLLAIVSFFLLLMTFRILQKVILTRLERIAEHTKTTLDDVFIHIVRTLRPQFYIFLAFYVSVTLLQLPENVTQFLQAVLFIVIIYQLIGAVQIFIDYIGARHIKPNVEHSEAVDVLKLISKIVLWSIGILLILSNLGVNITSLIAGLGIGGIAVALAVQNILGDLLSSFAIYFDKPFQLGDFIIVGDKMGVVKHIGVKTTRIQALQGEELVIPNQQLTSSQIQNFKKMEKRRVPFKINLSLDTPLGKAKQFPKDVEAFLQKMDDIVFDRAHLLSIGQYALEYEIVYYVMGGDYTKYMDIQQDINWHILQILEKDKISLAIPARYIRMQNVNKK